MSGLAKELTLSVLPRYIISFLLSLPVFLFYLLLVKPAPPPASTTMFKVGGWLKGHTPGHAKSLDSLNELAQRESLDIQSFKQSLT